MRDMNQCEYLERVIREIALERDHELYWSRNGPELRAMFFCSDTFWWATADCEVIEPEELDDMLAYIDQFKETTERHDGSTSTYPAHWGPMLWICKKRNLRPMAPFYQAHHSINNREKGHSYLLPPEAISELMKLPERNDPRNDGGLYEDPP
jgi:hypothetical protein